MNFKIIRTGLIIALFSSFTANVVAAELTIPEDKEVIKFDAWPGAVTFAHKMHAGLSITECSTCHHKMQPGDTKVAPCHECHKHKAAPGETPKARKIFHTRCTGCHEYTIKEGKDAGPRKSKCNLCHIDEE